MGVGPSLMKVKMVEHNEGETLPRGTRSADTHFLVFSHTCWKVEG